MIPIKVQPAKLTSFAALVLAVAGLLSSCCGISPPPSAAKGATQLTVLAKTDFSEPATIKVGSPTWKIFNSGTHTWKVYEAAPAHHERVPLVIVLHELNGLSQGSLHLARELASQGSQGCHVFLPVLFGGFGDQMRHVFSLSLFDRWHGWHVWKRDSMGPVKERTAALCRRLSADHGNAPVVVIGNCLSGSLALALLSEPCVRGAVVCQPALPTTLTISDGGRRALALSDADWRAIRAELAAHPEKRAIGFRFLRDCVSPAERMDEIEGCLKDRFQAYVLATKDDWKGVPPHAKWIEASVSDGHSTVTGLAKMQESDKAKGRREVLAIVRQFIRGASSH